MKRPLRFLVLTFSLALMASPVFADGGPAGGGNPDPPPNGNGNTVVTSTTSSSTSSVLQTILTYLGL